MLIYDTLIPYYNKDNDIVLLPDDFDCKQPNLNGFDIGYYKWFDKYTISNPNKIGTLLNIHFENNQLMFLRNNMLYLPFKCFLDKSNLEFYNFSDVKEYIDDINKKKELTIVQ